MRKHPPSNSDDRRVAIVHDWLIGGGAELVVEQLHKLYPDAPIYTSYATPEWRKRLDNKVVTGWLQYLGFVRKFVPFLRIWWFTHLDLSGYDLVISSSGAEAKGIKVPQSTYHINYCHAPTHYYWSRYESYLERPGFGIFDPLARFGLRLLVGPLRIWDYRAAQRPDIILTNSTFTKSQVQRYYRRESTVVFPPVNLERFAQKTNRKTTSGGFLVSGRHTPYKRFDLAVGACTKLGLPLTVIGDGPDTPRLRRMAGPTINFIGKASDKALEDALANADALLFPGLDDFGITAIEAFASGTPVIAYRGGGALDYIKPGVTGEFFGDQTVESLCNALQSFGADNYERSVIRLHAQQFSENAFRANIREIVRSTSTRPVRSTISASKY